MYRQDEIILEAYERLGTVPKTADEIGVSQDTIRRALKRNGVKYDARRQRTEAPWFKGRIPHNQKVTDEELIEACKTLTSGEIQKKYGIRQCTLYERCVKLGIRPVSNPVVISWPNGQSRSDRTYRGRCRHYGVTYDPKVKREAVVERDNAICQICGKRCDPNDKRWGSFGPNYPTLDHIRPLSKGGTHTWDNVQCACGMCNSNKRDLLYG